MKLIRYYEKNQYGNLREFVHPDNASDAALIQRLTGQKTIDGSVRLVIEGLSDGSIQFEKVSAP